VPNDSDGAAEATITLEADGAATHQAVLDGLVAYNRAFAPPSAATPIVLAARDSDGALVGGLVGETLWAETGDGWLQIALLWVADAQRGRGVGRRLLRAAEAEGARRGCRHVALDTYEFQARPFYEREGYAVFGVQEHYPPGFRRYFMRKTLPDGDA
jgi:GNAT superfamily N-acetyltransferase